MPQVLDQLVLDQTLTAMDSEGNYQELTVIEFLQRLEDQSREDAVKRSQRALKRAVRIAEQQQQRRRYELYWAEFKGKTIAANYTQFSKRYTYHIKNTGKQPPQYWMCQFLGWANTPLNRKRVRFLEAAYWQDKANHENVMYLV